MRKSSRENSTPATPRSDQPTAGNGIGKLDHAWTSSTLAWGEGAVATSADTMVDRRSPLSLDAPHIQQTKDRIREIVEQITRLTQSPIEPTDFWAASLPRMVSAMGAECSAIWVFQPDNGWSLLASHRLPSQLVEVAHPESPSDELAVRQPLDTAVLLDALDDRMEHALNNDSNMPLDNKSIVESHYRLLDEAKRERQPVLIPPREASLHKKRPLNPTDSLVMLVPVPIALEGGELWLEILQAPSGGPASQRGYLRFAAQMGDLIGEYLKTFRLRILERDQSFLRLAHHSLSESMRASSLESGLSNLLRMIRDHCHASHAILLTKKSNLMGRLSNWRVTAIAGLEKVDRRAEGILCIERAANELDEVNPNSSEVCFQHSDAERRSQAEWSTSVQRLVSVFAIGQGYWLRPMWVHAKEPVATKTLLEELLQPGDHDTRGSESVRHNVALLISWNGTELPPKRFQEHAGLLVRLGVSALRPAWAPSDIASATQRKQRWKTFRKWCAALLIMAVAVGVLAFPVPIQIETTATLLPVSTSEIYAPADGRVEQIAVVQGQHVKRGDLLLRLASPALMADHEQAIAAHYKSKQRFLDLENKLLRDRSLTSTERDTLESERESLSQITKLEEQTIALLQQQISDLNIVASRDGIVETWRVDETLRDRPVRLGQWLLSLRAPDSQWEFEALIPEKNLRELGNQSAGNGDAFARLVSAPQRAIPIRISPKNSWRPVASGSVQRSEFSALQSSQILVAFHVDTASLGTEPIAGASARITVPTGRGPLVWALTKDFVENLIVRGAMWLQ